MNDSIQDDFRQENYSAGLRTYLAQFKNKVEPYLSKKNVKEIAEYQEKQRQENIKKYGPIGAIIFGLSILIFIFIGIKCEKLQKEEEEYYEWKKNPSSCSGFVSSSYNLTSSSYDSFSSPHSSSSYDSSSSSSSSWSGGSFDGGGSTGGW